MSLVSNQSRIFELVVGRCWLTIAATIVIIATLAAGMQYLITVDVGIRNHFNMDDPHLTNLENFESTYAVSDVVLVIVDPPDKTIFTRESLGVIEELTQALRRVPYVTRVDSIANYAYSYGYEDDLIVEHLGENAAHLDDTQIERVRTIALNAIEIAGRFVSRDGHLGGLIVTLSLPEDVRASTKIEVVDSLYELIDEQRAANQGFAYHIYGELILNYAIRSALEKDMAVLAPIAFAVMILVSILVLRSIWGTFGILAMLIAVLTAGFGFAGWIGLRFYGESAAALFVLMAIAVAHSVHIIQAMFDGMRRGMDRKAATIYSLEINTRPVFLTSITTAIGFLSLNFSEMPPFRVMGNIVAVGALCAFVYSVTLLPALLAIMPIKVPAKRKHKTEFFERLGSFVISNRRMLLWAFVILSVVSVVGLFRLEFNDNNLKLLHESNELRQSADFINEHFSGLDSFEYSLNSGQAGGVTDINFLLQVDAFTEWLREQPEVSHVTSITDVLKRLNQNLHGDADGTYVLPVGSDLASQYLALYEFSLPVGRDLNNLIDFDRAATRLTVTIEEMSVREQIEFDQRASAWLETNTPQIKTGATGVAIVSAYSVMRNIVNMLIGTFIAMSIVSLILVFVFRSVRLGLLSLIPNFLPAIMTMGAWGFAVGTVSVAASIVTAISFGIIVDDTIHLLSKYLKSREEGNSPIEAIKPTFRLVGRPLLATTLIFALLFLVFGTSDLSTHQTLGVLVGLTVIVALIADFLLFPPLLIALDKTKALASRATGQ